MIFKIPIQEYIQICFIHPLSVVFQNFCVPAGVQASSHSASPVPRAGPRGAVLTVEVMTSQEHDTLHALDASAQNLLSAGDDLAELQSFSRHLLAKLDESRSIGQFGQAEIELLRKKLSVVVSAFSAERQKIENELNTVRLRRRRM